MRVYHGNQSWTLGTELLSYNLNIPIIVRGVPGMRTKCNTRQLLMDLAAKSTLGLKMLTKVACDKMMAESNFHFREDFFGHGPQDFCDVEIGQFLEYLSPFGISDTSTEIDAKTHPISMPKQVSKIIRKVMNKLF